MDFDLYYEMLPTRINKTSGQTRPLKEDTRNYITIQNLERHSVRIRSAFRIFILAAKNKCVIKFIKGVSYVGHYWNFPKFISSHDGARTSNSEMKSVPPEQQLARIYSCHPLPSIRRYEQHRMLIFALFGAKDATCFNFNCINIDHFAEKFIELGTELGQNRSYKIEIEILASFLHSVLIHIYISLLCTYYFLKIVKNGSLEVSEF